MKKKYQGTTRVKRQQLQDLRKEFEILKMEQGESVDEYFSRTLAIANKMHIHGEKIEDVAVVEKILRSMDSKFSYVVCSIEESKDIDTLSIDELQSSLLVHEQRMTSNISPTEEQALKTSTHGENSAGRGSNRRRGRGRGRWKERGRGGGHDPHKQTSNNNLRLDRSNILCYRCHKFGHYKSK
ncbi:uncharacterized protein LOC120084046 [Benincasa hispida]|uniref:uncharacterized protein LOC120084046 n=1 Tax=Benincasa hispida TaxID=102211 RepID=UPI001902AC36|nr:uncharacterized protein LOC120084046 [Benincasa hispida]